MGVGEEWASEKVVDILDGFANLPDSQRLENGIALDTNSDLLCNLEGFGIGGIHSDEEETRTVNVKMDNQPFCAVKVDVGFQSCWTREADVENCENSEPLGEDGSQEDRGEYSAESMDNVISEAEPLLRGGTDKWNNWEHGPGRLTCCHAFRYFHPFGLTRVEDKQFGTNFYGMNLFGVMFWGMAITTAMEVQYLVLATFLKDGLLEVGTTQWLQYIQLNYSTSVAYYSAFWISIFVLLSMAWCVWVAPSMKNRRNFRYFNGVFCTLYLWSFASIPAGIAGYSWEQNMHKIVPKGAERTAEFGVHSGWLLLVVVPVLWPIICGFYLFVAAAIGSVYYCCCLRGGDRDFESETGRLREDTLH